MAALATSWSLGAERPTGATTAIALRSVRLYLWAFYTDIRRMNETTNETTQSASPGRTDDLGLCIAWSEVAEDARFELARGCPQHAFQQCWPAFTGVRHRSRTAQTRSGWTSVNGPGRERMRQKLRQEARRPPTWQHVSGATPDERRGDLVGAGPGPDPSRPGRAAVHRVQVRARRPGQPRRTRRHRRVPLGGHAGPHTGLSERTVRTCLDRLAAEGIIWPCDPGIVVARIKRAVCSRRRRRSPRHRPPRPGCQGPRAGIPLCR